MGSCRASDDIREYWVRGCRCRWRAVCEPFAMPCAGMSSTLLTYCSVCGVCLPLVRGRFCGLALVHVAKTGLNVRAQEGNLGWQIGQVAFPHPHGPLVADSPCGGGIGSGPPGVGHYVPSTQARGAEAHKPEPDTGCLRWAAVRWMGEWRPNAAFPGCSGVHNGLSWLWLLEFIVEAQVSSGSVTRHAPG